MTIKGSLLLSFPLLSGFMGGMRFVRY